MARPLALSLAINQCSGGGGAVAIMAPGWGGNPQAPLWAPHDIDTGQAIAAAGANYFSNRYPLTVKTGATILSFCGGSQDAVNVDYNVSTIWQRSSTDGGVTWSAVKEAYHQTSPVYSGGITFIYPLSAVVHTGTGRVHLIWARVTNGTAGTPANLTDWALFTSYSNDAGVTWSVAANISSTAKQTSAALPVPADFATPLLAGYGSTDAEWGWTAGMSHGICLQLGAKAGRLIVPLDHRYSKDTSNTSWSHTIVSDDNGDHWKLGGGLLEATAGNANANEISICECADTTLYMSIRRVGNSNQNLRYYSTSSDQGLHWATMQVATTDGSTQIASVNTAGSVVSMPNGDLFMSIINDAGVRANLTIFKSTDNGATWPSSKVLCEGPVAYSSLCVLDGSTLLSVFETTKNVAAYNSTFGGPYQYINLVKWNRTWFAATNDNVYDWQFNEAAAGTATATAGTTLLDHGLYGVSGQGSAAATYSATGITFSGSGAGAILNFRRWDGTNVSTIGGALDGLISSMTFELDATIPNAAADHVLFASKQTDTGSAGYEIAVVGGFYRFTARKSSLKSAVITGGTAVNTGVRHVVQCVWDTAQNKALMYLDGVSDATAVTSTGNLNVAVIFNTAVDTTLGSSTGLGTITAATNATPIAITKTGHGLLTGSLVVMSGVVGNTAANSPPTWVITAVDANTFTLNGSAGNGARTSGGTYTATSPPAPSGTIVSRFRVSKAALTSGFLTTSSTKTAPATFLGYSAALPANDPTSISNCLLWVAAGYDGGLHSGTDQFGGGDAPKMPVLVGSGVSSYRDIVSNRLFTTQGPTRGIFWDYDTTVGWHLRQSFYDTTASGKLGTAAASTDFDFIQNTCVFTVAMVVKLTSTGGFQGLFSNNASNSAPGIDLFYDGPSQNVYLQIRGNGANRFSEEFTGVTLDMTNWWFIGIVGQGANTNKVKLYTGKYNGSFAVPTLAAPAQSTSSITGGTLAVASTQPLLIGARAAGASEANMRYKNVVLYNATLTAGNMQTLANFGIL